MAEFMLLPVTEAEAADKPSINTGVSMVGRGGHTYACGHCGRTMMHDFDISQMQVDMVFQCGSCGGNNMKPPV